MKIKVDKSNFLQLKQMICKINKINQYLEESCPQRNVLNFWDVDLNTYSYFFFFRFDQKLYMKCTTEHEAENGNRIKKKH